MDKLFAIAKITKASGLRGEVRVRSLVRHFNEYVQDKNLSLGFSEHMTREVILKRTTGIGKKQRFLFEGVSNLDEAETLIGQTLFAAVSEGDPINMVSPELLGATVMSISGDYVGELVDMLTLPANDIYVIENGEKEVLIPIIPEIVKGIDLKNGIVTLAPIDGLLD